MKKAEGTLRIKIASSDEIKKSREEWNKLVKSMKFPTVFLTWEWITTWLEHFGKNYKPLILFIQDENDIASIIPLAQRTMKLENGFLKVRAISFCGSMELCPDHLDIICADEKANIYIEKTLEFLTNNYTAWDVLHFASLAGEGHLSYWLQSAYKKYGMRLLGKTAAPFITIENGLNTFLNGFNRKKRYNLNRERKILFENKSATVKRIETQIELEKGIGDLFQLHKARANVKRIKSTFAEEAIINFHRALARIFLELGWLRLYLLRSNTKVISAAYGFVFEKRFYYYQTGLDPEWQQFSAGKILIFKILEEIFSDDIAEFDFLNGSEDYKTFWTKDRRLMMTINIYNKNMTGIIENWAYGSRHMLKSVLKKTPIFDALKQWLKMER